MQIVSETMTLENFVRPENVVDIVSSKTYRNGAWASVTHLQGFGPGVDKSVLPVDIEQFRILVVTTVKPGTKVATHSHDEAVLRYVVNGSLTICGVTYRAGDWVLVPRGYPYDVATVEGYTTIAGYGVACSK